MYRTLSTIRFDKIAHATPIFFFSKTGVGGEGRDGILRRDIAQPSRRREIEKKRRVFLRVFLDFFKKSIVVYAM